MNKYIIRYNSSDGDTTSVWVYASSKEDAIREAKREYWDIDEIVSVCQA